jgi:hypothetical protein
MQRPVTPRGFAVSRDVVPSVDGGVPAHLHRSLCRPAAVNLSGTHAS